MKKKLLAVTLTIFMLFSLVACDSDKKVSDETDAMKTVEEPVTEKVTVKKEEKETKTTKYKLTQMNSGFNGGIAWATVTDDTGTRKVLINKKLQIVYELPKGMETGDIFDGKAVVINSDQASNPGFMILGADGTVLYKCSDNLGDDKYARVVSLTKDGGAVYEMKENGLTGLGYICVLNDKFKMVAQIELPLDALGSGKSYFYLSDGVYCCCLGRSLEYILNVKDNIVLEVQNNTFYGVSSDIDRCVGLEGTEPYTGVVFVTNAEKLDYSEVTDMDTLYNLLYANRKTSESDMTRFVFNHGHIVYDYDKNYVEGFSVPDFGAKLRGIKLSNDGKYLALQLQGADSHNYYTVINRDGQSLYEPVLSEKLRDIDCVCDGYIMAMDGNGITPDGKAFKLGDGTALSGIGENSVASCIHSGSGFTLLMISDGYIFWENKLYQLDGKEVTTVTALK